MSVFSIAFGRHSLERHFVVILACCVILPAVAAQSDRPISTAPAGLSSSSWSSLRHAYDAHRHRITRTAHGHVASNPGQRWSTSFDERGFLVTPDDGSWHWGLELVAYGRAGDEHFVEKPGGTTAADQRLERDWDAVLTEWYLNDRRGLEHGYTLHQRPAPAVAPGLTVRLSVRGGLLPLVTQDRSSVSFASRQGTVLTYSGLTVFDADGQHLPARFECIGQELRVHVDDRAARYPLTIDPLAQSAYVKAANPDSGDLFGNAVAVSGSTVVVGAPFEDSGATGVNGDHSDNTASNSGAAYVFVREATGWRQQAYLKASNTGAGDSFGFSVAIAGDTIVIGAFGEDSDARGVNGDQRNDRRYGSGAAYVFVRSGTTWTQQAYLKASNADSIDAFGFAVAVSGSTIVVGAVGEDSKATGVNGDESSNDSELAGAAYVFVRSGATWTQQAYLKASNTGQGCRFGISVSAAENTVVVGADYAHHTWALGSGGAYVFVRSGVTWSQQAHLTASSAADIGDEFGCAVSVSRDTIVVGARGEDSSATGVGGNQYLNDRQDSGAAYVFVRTGSTWSLQSYLKASNTGAADRFGQSVSVSEDMIVVGAPEEDSSATGIDGDQADDNSPASGAVYVFARDLTSWVQLQYVKASNTGAADTFGSAVAVGGLLTYTLAVGAPREDSGAACTNGDEHDETSPDAGAAFFFWGTLFGPLNWAIRLTNGVNQHVDVARSPFTIPTRGITLEAWMTYDDDTLPSGPHRFPTIVRHTTAPNAESYFLRVEAGATSARVLAFGIRNASGLSHVRYSFAPGQLKTWTHVAATFDGNVGTIFLSGVPVASNAIQGPIVDGGGMLRIGNGDTTLAGNEVWHGMLDEVRIWPFARSGPEIRETLADVLGGVPNGVTCSFQLNDSAAFWESSQALSLVPVGPPPFVAGPKWRYRIALGATLIGTATTGCTATPTRMTLGSSTRAGNADFAVVCVDARAGTAGALFLAAHAATAPWRFVGVDVWLDPLSILQVALPAVISPLGVARLPLPLPYCTEGTTLHAQLILVDPLCGPKGLVSSAAVRIAVQSRYQ